MAPRRVCIVDIKAPDLTALDPPLYTSIRTDRGVIGVRMHVHACAYVCMYGDGCTGVRVRSTRSSPRFCLTAANAARSERPPSRLTTRTCLLLSRDPRIRVHAPARLLSSVSLSLSLALFSSLSVSLVSSPPLDRFLSDRLDYVRTLQRTDSTDSAVSPSRRFDVVN